MNIDQYNRLKPLCPYWQSLKTSGSVSGIQTNDVAIMNQVHFELLGIRQNITCSNCITELITYVFIQYDKFNNSIGEGLEAERKRRPRIQNPS